LKGRIGKTGKLAEPANNQIEEHMEEESSEIKLIYTGVNDSGLVKGVGFTKVN